jgi:hypothetical protein
LRTISARTAFRALGRDGQRAGNLRLHPGRRHRPESRAPDALSPLHPDGPARLRNRHGQRDTHRGPGSEPTGCVRRRKRGWCSAVQPVDSSTMLGTSAGRPRTSPGPWSGWPLPACPPRMRPRLPVAACFHGVHPVERIATSELPLPGRVPGRSLCYVFFPPSATRRPTGDGWE